MTTLKTGKSAMGRQEISSIFWKIEIKCTCILLFQNCNIRKPQPRTQIVNCIGGERLPSDRLQAWNRYI